jgi:hypothetical protein
MVAHADTDSLESFLLCVHTDYIYRFQNFYVCGSSGHHDAFHGTPWLLFPLCHFS